MFVQLRVAEQVENGSIKGLRRKRSGRLLDNSSETRMKSLKVKLFFRGDAPTFPSVIGSLTAYRRCFGFDRQPNRVMSREYSGVFLLPLSFTVLFLLDLLIVD